MTPDLTATQPASETRKRITPESKAARVLEVLIERGDRGLNRFEAERLCHCHVLPTSISNLQRQYGLTFDREQETVHGFGGAPTEVMRYWIAEGDIERARKLLGEVEEGA